MSDNDKNAVMTDGFTVTAFSERHAEAAAMIEKDVFSEPWRLRAIRDLFLAGCVTSDIADGASGGVRRVREHLGASMRGAGRDARGIRRDRVRA